MSSGKRPSESAEQRQSRVAEEQRIQVMAQRADAEEAAAGRRLLTRRTRRVMRVFGARTAMAGAGGALGAISAPSSLIPFSGSSASYPLGYGGMGSGGGGGGVRGGGEQAFAF